MIVNKKKNRKIFQLFFSKEIRMDVPRKDHQLQTRQFVKNVLDFSSQYGREQSGSYTVANVRGCPTNYPKYGDFLESCVFVC